MINHDDIKDFIEAVLEPLGPSFSEVLCRLLKDKLGEDPSKTLLERPESLYKALKEVLGGENRVKMLLEMAVSSARVKYGLKIDADNMLNALKEGRKGLVISIVQDAAETVKRIEKLGHFRLKS